MSVVFLVPGKPQNFKSVKQSHDEIELEWGPPVEVNGKVTEYVIKYSFFEHNSCDDDETPRITKKNKTLSTQQPFNYRHVLKSVNDNIYAYWNYTFTIVAVNKISKGEPSNEVQVRTNATCKYFYIVSWVVNLMILSSFL